MGAIGGHFKFLGTFTKLYEGVEGANVEAELVADLVGDYVFTDSDFVRKLSVENQNVFQKLYDEIKYLCKVATAGSKEARQLEKVKKTFAEVYRESNAAQKNTAENSGVRYSLGDVEIPTRKQLEDKGSLNIVDISIAKTKGTYAERRAQIKQEMQNIISKPYLNKDTQTMIFLTNKSYEHAFSNSGGIQLNAAEHLPELIENAVLTHAEEITHGSEYATGIYTFFAASKADKIRPVKLKVKEFSYKGQELPKNIKEYFDKNPQDYAASYDTVVLEVEEIEESSIGSVNDIDSKSLFLDPNELSEISITDLLNLVNGSAKKYVPDNSGTNTEKGNDMAPVKKSLSEQGSENNQYGDYNVSGKDIMLEAPLREDIAKTEMVDDIGPVKENTSETEKQESDEGIKGYNYFDSLEEESAHNHSTITVNGISITLQIPFGKSTYKVWADYNNGDEIVPWSTTQDFDTFEEAKEYASMFSFEAAEYDGGLTPADKFWRKTEDIAPVKETVSKPKSVGKTPTKASEFSDMDEYFEWLLDEQSDAKDIAPVGAENVADSEEADRASSLLDIDSEEADRVSSLLNTNSEKSKGKTSENRVIETVEDRIAAKLETAETALENNRRLQQESAMEFDIEIAQ